MLGQYRQAYAKARFSSTLIDNLKDVSDIDATWDDEPCEWADVPYEATNEKLEIFFPDEIEQVTWSDGSYLNGSNRDAGASLAAMTPGGRGAVDAEAEQECELSTAEKGARDDASGNTSHPRPAAESQAES